MHLPTHRISASVAIGFLLAVPSPSWAQGVFKCTVGGKTVYQAAACPGEGKTLALERGPSEQQVLEAKKRADAEKAKAGAYRPPTPQREQAVVGGGAVDCTRLNRERAEAFGRRNGAMRMSRATNIDNSAAVARDEADIRAVESQMVRGGCRPE